MEAKRISAYIFGHYTILLYYLQEYFYSIKVMKSSFANFTYNEQYSLIKLLITSRYNM